MNPIWAALISERPYTIPAHERMEREHFRHALEAIVSGAGSSTFRGVTLWDDVQ